MSSTFLFDVHRTAQFPFRIDPGRVPTVDWSFALKGYPPFGAESAPIVDSNGNLYFGAHNGIFYSITGDGTLRWVFCTKRKIYSSPSFTPSGDICFCGADGFCYCLSPDGDVRWVVDLAEGYRPGRLRGHVALVLKNFGSVVDVRRRQVMTEMSWCSPLVTGDGLVWATAYGAGLVLLRADTGEVVTKCDLGTPRFQKCNPVVDTQGRVYMADQRGRARSFDQQGRERFSIQLGIRLRGDGGLSYDLATDRVLVPLSRGEGTGVLFAIDTNGVVDWRTKLPGAIRGHTAVGKNALVVCTLTGWLVSLSREDGAIQWSLRLTDAARGLWTTPCLDINGNILVVTKDGAQEGRLVCVDASGELRWTIDIGKSLMPPVLLAHNELVVGSWRGVLQKLKNR